MIDPGKENLPSKSREDADQFGQETSTVEDVLNGELNRFSLTDLESADAWGDILSSC